MDQIAKTYSFNDHAQLKLIQRIKEALDPKQMPGREEWYLAER
jgi:hypothetical protein